MKNLLSLLLLTCATPAFAQIAVLADTIHTMAGPAIIDGVVLINAGKIERVGPASEITAPADYETLRARVVTPGLVDAHSTVGLAGILNTSGDQDQLEKSAPIQPELRAIDAYNTREDLVTHVRRHGVTTVHTGHGPGALISGQTMVVKTIEGPVEAVTLLPERMLAMTLSDIVARNFNSPGTRAKGMAMLRGELIKAQAYQKKKADPDPAKRPPVDLKMEALTQLLEGKYKALITANTVTDIQAALRLAGEFQFPLVLDGAAESYMLIDEIKNAGAEVIIHPTMARAAGEMKNMSMETAGILARAGIPVSLQTGFEGYVPRTRVLIYEAAIAAANGLAHEDALKAITSHPARLLGIDNRVGSIRPGLDADLALFDGNPFEYLAKVCVVIINGVVVDSLCE